MAERNNGTETNDPKTIPASTALNIGDWLKSNGAGEFVGLTPGSPAVEGLLMEKISTTDPDYASEKVVACDIPTQNTDRFLMPVATGTATSEMEGLTFDVATTPNFGSLDVSGAGTQFEITRFISASLVEVRVVKTQVDAT